MEATRAKGFSEDLASDIGESTNLVQQESALTATLLAKLKRWRTSVGADPMLENQQYRGDANSSK